MHEMPVYKKRRLAIATATPIASLSDIARLASKYIKVNQILETGSFNYGSTLCGITLIGFGQYNNCYKITSPEDMSSNPLMM
jgi:hypothetical protein